MSCHDCGYAGVAVHKGPKHCISYLRGALETAKIGLDTMDIRVQRLEQRL